MIAAGCQMSALVRAPMGVTSMLLVDQQRLLARVGEMAATTFDCRHDHVADGLRRLADEIESEALLLADDRDSSGQLAKAEHHIEQGLVCTDEITIPINEGLNRLLGDFVRRLRVIVRGAVLSVAHGSPSIGAADVAPSTVSDPIVGDTSGAVEHPPAPAPDARSD